jgi:signal transduction histidine kinase
MEKLTKSRLRLGAFYILIFTVHIFAQNTTDRLKQLLNTQKGNERALTLLSLSQRHLYIDAKQSKSYAEEALNIARQIGNEDRIAQSYYFLGFSKYRLGNFTGAINDLYESVEGYEKLKDYNSLAMTKNLIAIINYDYGRYEISAKLYSQNLVYYRSMNMTREYSKMLTNLGTVYTKKGDYDKALSNMLAADSILKQYAADNENYYYFVGNLKCNIGEAYFGKKEYKQAIDNYLESLKHLERIKLTDGVANTQKDLGLVYLEMNNFPQSISYFNLALNNYKQINYSKGIMDVKENIVRYYKAVKQPGKALEKLQNLEAMCTDARDTLMLIKCYNHYADIYESKSNYALSSKYFRKYFDLKNIIDNEENKQTMIGLQVLTNAEEKEMENETLKRENDLQKERMERNRIIYYSVIGGLILFSAFLLILFKEQISIRKYTALLEKKNEEINTQNNKLEEVIEAKDKFFSILAHNLKNPFWALLGLNSILEESYDEMPDEDKKGIIANMGKALKNVYKLFEDLLSWAKTQQSAIKPVKERHNASELIYNSIKPHETRAKEKNVEIIVDAEEKIQLFADRFMLETVIGNCVDNAIKFSETDSKVTVSAFEDEGSTGISIEDTGIGMPNDKIDKLFRIDENISSEGTMHEKGTGLGLIISKEFIKLNDGELYVQSVENEGTKFTIKLPNE